ncbi:hypothetical protein D3C73_653030 [compost metagenome]
MRRGLRRCDGSEGRGGRYAGRQRPVGQCEDGRRCTRTGPPRRRRGHVGEPSRRSDAGQGQPDRRLSRGRHSAGRKDGRRQGRFCRPGGRPRAARDHGADDPGRRHSRLWLGQECRRRADDLGSGPPHHHRRGRAGRRRRTGGGRGGAAGPATAGRPGAEGGRGPAVRIRLHHRPCGRRSADAGRGQPGFRRDHPDQRLDRAAGLRGL